MPTHNLFELVHRRENDLLVEWLRLQNQTLSARAGELGLSLVDQTKIVTAASELARNSVTYGGGGSIRIEILQETGKRGLRLTFEDQGPGISDIEKAMSDGYTTGNRFGRIQETLARIFYRIRTRSGHSYDHPVEELAA